MRLTFLSTCLVLFGAFSQVAGAPVGARGLEGVRALSGSDPETWWNENQAAREAKRTWHAHEKGGPGKYPGEVLANLKAAREEAVKRSESAGTTVEVPKVPNKPASAGGGQTVPPGKGWKKREGEGSFEARDASSAEEGAQEEGGEVKPVGSAPPGKPWRRHIGDVRSADDAVDDSGDGGGPESQAVGSTQGKGW
ncbi:hypothetical protein M407DRAFT_243002 [Tulasnella calospora MUT 4182]|uniref:Uncharacterized protein n=1 Tax=Tulasnella calospora MUT 4182 TaxID=1051891 RepID=A0A0C3QN76_9AGAM|nr:hypothetical protein M407DRAFT_243002 [Tulasnella calospora MUT 4182]